MYSTVYVSALPWKFNPLESNVTELVPQVLAKSTITILSPASAEAGNVIVQALLVVLIQ